MIDERRVSIVIPSYERTDLLFASFAQVMDEIYVDEIVIVDDCSSEKVWEEIKERAKTMPKVKVFRNSINLDCYKNKRRAVELASNEWVILLDSDNVIDPTYLYHIFKNKFWDKNNIYTPDFAQPNFDFRHFSGLLITQGNVSSWIDEPLFEVCLNACNYFVNRDEYLKVFDSSIDPVTSDSIYFCYKWLESGNRIQVVEGLKYFHRVHGGSHYQNNVSRTPNGFHESVLNKIRHLI